MLCREAGCWCRTDELGPATAECCSFPFLYAGQQHHTCVEVEGGQAWCATQLDAAGRYFRISYLKSIVQPFSRKTLILILFQDTT